MSKSSNSKDKKVKTDQYGEYAEIVQKIKDGVEIYDKEMDGVPYPVYNLIKDNIDTVTEEEIYMAYKKMRKPLNHRP
jgi:hypothetical protein